MMMRWLWRAVTVMFVLCLAVLGGLAYRLAAPRHDIVSTASAQAGASPSIPLGQFTPLGTPRPAPAVSFVTATGEARSLADFQGRMVLVNLWATWCVPCVTEMPSLERLQAKLGSSLAIVAISEDRNGAQVVEPFRAKIGLKALTTYLDPRGTASRAFAVQGLPTTFLIDRDGMILGSLAGGTEWDAPEMLARLASYLKQDPRADQRAGTGP